MSHLASRTFPSQVCELDGVEVDYRCVNVDGVEVYYCVNVWELMESKSATAPMLMRRHRSCPTVFTYSVRWGEGQFKYANGQGWDEEWSGIKEASYAWRFCA